MFGCLGRIGCLALLVVIGAAAWFWRAEWYPRVTGEQVVAADASSEWMLVTEASSARGRASVERMAGPRAPEAIALGPAEAAGYVLAGVLRDLPQSAQEVQAAVIGDRLYVRANVALGDLGGDLLGPLAGMVGDRESLLLGGTMCAVSPGVGQFRVAEVKVRDFALPSRVIPGLLRQLRGSRPVPEGVAADGVPLELPPGVGDVLVGRGKVTLYQEATDGVSHC